MKERKQEEKEEEEKERRGDRRRARGGRGRVKGDMGRERESHEAAWRICTDSFLSKLTLQIQILRTFQCFKLVTGILLGKFFIKFSPICITFTF